MPAYGTVTPLVTGDLRTAGDLLRALSSGACEPVDLVAVPVDVDAAVPVAPDSALDAFLAMPVSELAAALRLTGLPGQTAQVAVKAGEAAVRVAFIGVGDRSPRSMRRAGAELGRLLGPGETAFTSAVAGRPAGEARAFAEGVVLGTYRYSQKSGGMAASAQGAGPRVLLPPDGEAGAAAVGEAATFAMAVALARDLTNAPSVRKCPQWLAEAAVDVATEHDLGVRVWTEHELADAGFGGITAVGAGSERPPRLIELRYAPAGARRHVVLVGKGITFDSGGLSLKPSDGMKAMKTDMAGGAAVIAVMSALRGLGVEHQVTGLVAAAENMPSGSAYRPGDVITAFGGRTIEVLNTDAEGRLVLADAIAYADAQLDPDQIVDIATLTGAARIALGTSRAALYATSDELAGALLEAGEASGDRLWRMPLVEDYRAALDSPVADLANVARGDEGAGSVLAALFLREFAGSRSWAHLDVAGAARSGTDDGELSAGGTGFGTRLLLRWLLDG